MAHTITGASLEPIKNTLIATDGYHPGDANTFYDWSMQAGDRVTIRRGNEEYEIPVFSTKTVWKGSPQTVINATGKKEHDSVNKLKQKNFRRGGASVRSQEYIYKEFTSSDGMLHSAIFMSESKLTTHFDNAISDVHSNIVQTAEQIYSEVYASNSTLYSYVDRTATYMSSVVVDAASSLGSAILQTASQIRAEVHAANSTLYSYVDQTATYISAVVESVESSLGSNILQTANQIYSEVHAANSTVYSYIDQTATSITSRVENVNQDLHSEILQTQSMIRSAVWTANSTVYAYVDQTASYILDHVGERSGSKVIASLDEPQDSPDNPLNVGDLWVEGTEINTWDDFPEGEPWIDYDPYARQLGWTDVSGQKIHVWEDGKWKLVEDGRTLIEETAFVRLKDQVSTIAYNYEKIDGEVRGNIARLDVRADSINSSVKQNSKSIGELGSNINQTATQIRSEVHAANSKLYSVLERTATSIRSYVADEIHDLGSEILQTASQIRAEVHAANSTLYSFVDMTATYIRQEVANTASSLRSSITTEANRISLVVEGTGANAKIKPASIVNSINNGSSSIVISANHINLDGYVKASDITANLIKTKISQIDTLAVGYVSVASGKSITFNGSSSGTSTELSYANLINVVKDMKIELSDDTYTLYKKNFNGGDTDWVQVGTFSRATTLDGAWSSGTYTVEASPQGDVKSTSLHSIVVDENLAPSGTTVRAYLKIHYATGNPQSPSADTGFTRQLISLSGATVYNNGKSDGWDLARTFLSPPGESTAHDYFDVGIPASTYNQGSSYRFTVSVDDSYGYIKNALNQTVARVSHTKKHDGWDLARTFVVAPVQSTESSMTVGIPASTYNQSSSYNFSVSVDDNYAYIKNGLNQTVARVSHTKKQDGWNLARGFVSAPSASTANAYIDVGIPASTYNQGSSYRFTVSVDDDYGYIKNALNQTVARVSHTQYENGWKAGWNAYYNDSSDWISDYTSGDKKEVYIPRQQGTGTGQYDFYNSAYGRGKGNGSNATCLKWFDYTPGSGTTYYSKTLYCTSKEQTYPGSSTYYYYFRLEGNYAFSTGTSYTFYRTSWPT